MYEPIIVRSRRKTIMLIINNRAELIVRAPLRTSAEAISDLITAKSNWITAKQNEVNLRISNYPPRRYTDGEQELYLGEYFTLKYDNSEEVSIKENKIIIPNCQINNVELILKNWYNQQAKLLITKITECWAKTMNEHYNKLSISNARSRWGSCTSSRNITLNWRLIMCPLYVIDYIVIHELCHLKHMDHSKRFYCEIDKLFSHRVAATKWLKDNNMIIRV